MTIAFVFPPAWAPWSPSYAMALLGAARRAAGHDFVGFDLNIGFHNAVPEDDRRLWRDDEGAARPERRIRRRCHMHGRGYANIVAGFPGETDEQFEETARFVERVVPYFRSIGLPLMEIRRNSHIFDAPARYGIDDPARTLDWSTSDGRNTREMRLRRQAVLVEIVQDRLFHQGRQ